MGWEMRQQMGKGKREEKRVVCPLGLDTFHRAASLTFEKHFNSPLLLFPQGSHLILMTRIHRPALQRRNWGPDCHKIMKVCTSESCSRPFLVLLVGPLWINIRLAPILFILFILIFFKHHSWPLLLWYRLGWVKKPIPITVEPSRVSSCLWFPWTLLQFPGTKTELGPNWVPDPTWGNGFYPWPSHSSYSQENP